MARSITITTGAWQKDLEMTITVLDEELFAKECEDINKFFCFADQRVRTHGSHAKAGLALFAKECFQQIAFNDFKDIDWLVRQFDWGQGEGIEGYPSIEGLGIKITSIDNWFLDESEFGFEY
ncbi:DUF2528 family protein [Vibrio parahaemolyticus]